MVWEEVAMLEALTHLDSNPDLLQLFLPEGTGNLTCVAQFVICKMRAIKSSGVVSRSK